MPVACLLHACCMPVACLLHACCMPVACMLHAALPSHPIPSYLAWTPIGSACWRWMTLRRQSGQSCRRYSKYFTPSVPSSTALARVSTQSTAGALGTLLPLVSRHACRWMFASRRAVLHVVCSVPSAPRCIVSVRNVELSSSHSAVVACCTLHVAC
jgi:hypothetical protein